ncbi:FAST kinase domain-containing protein 2, mitochondrial isoform X3 [Lethenteron reissneri]|uniref:FAST kinase domain-containing protein 2, mitochondrial isoform X3 n=1 Tax=Lethenteron reissneri TaxID=7753 RepID=UPI002AB612C8|nr:FAST kinase domain-containing protein 2, mitochondrial isoform X3 [Lethenteron reissneri]
MYGRVVSHLHAGGCAVPSWARSLNSFQTSSRRDALSLARCARARITRFSIHDVEQCKLMFSTWLTPGTAGGRDTGHAESRWLVPADKRKFTSLSKSAGYMSNTEQYTSIDDPQTDVIAYGRNVRSNRNQGNSRRDHRRAPPIATELVRTATERGDLLEPKIEMDKLLATCQTPSDVLELALDGLAPKLLNLDVTATTGEPSTMGAVDFAVHVPDVLDTRPCSLLIACWRTLRALPPDRAAYEQRRMLQHPHFPGLCQQVLRTSRYLTPGLLGYTLAAATRLGIPLRSRLVQMLIRTAQDRNTQALRAALTMRAQLALPEVDRVPVLLMLMYHLGPTVPTALKDKLVTQAWALFVLDQFTTANVLRLFFSLARMQHNAPELLSAASPIIAGNLQELKLSELLQLLKACNQLGYYNTQLFSSIAEHAVTRLQLYGLNEACTLLLLLSRLRFRHPGLLDAVALLLLQEQQQQEQQQEQPMPCHLDKKNLMVLLHIYSLLNHQPHGAAETFLEVLSSALEHHLPELSAHELFVGVRALCILGRRPPSAVASALLADHSCTELLSVSVAADSLKRLQNELELQAIRLSLHLQKKLPGVPAVEAASSSPDPNPSSLTRCPELPSVLTEALRGSGQVRVGVTVGGLYSIDAEVTLQGTEVLQFLQGNECLALPDQDNPHNQGDCLHVPGDGACILREDPLPKPLRVAMLWCHPAEFCLGSQHPCGKLALKVRNLHALGYRVTLVSSSQWKRLQPESRVPFLRQKLQLASGMAAECGS